jgi:hypothetical protein
MLLAMVPLVLVAFGVAGLVGQCSFSPLGPSINRGAPTVDVPSELRDAADRVNFPVFEPRLPGDWRSNSAIVTSLGSGAQAVRVGWLTGAAHYLRLSQSAASEEELVSAETQRRPQAEGTIEVAGQRWVVYQSIRSEKAWVSVRDGVRLLITGSANDAEYRALADAAVRAATVT